MDLKELGFVIFQKNIKIKTILKRCSQERNMRAGTENICGIAGLAMAMEMAYENLESDMLYIKGLKKYMIKKNLKMR